ncbi:MAG: substrate-binding periplasmic protein [Actinomycetota bacterium]
MRRVVQVALAATLFALSACVPPEKELVLARDYEIDTVMGEIQERGHIIIGIAEDAYPLGYVDHNDQAQGFTVAFGRKIADTLGVEARFISGPSEELLELPEEGLADVTFPALSIREQLVRKYAFTDPYFISHQRLLTTGEQQTIQQLSGAAVCSLASEETGVALDELDPTIEVIVADPFRCLRLLDRGKVVAVTGPDYLLAGLRDGAGRETFVTGDQLTTEALGAVLERGASAWVEFVNGVLYLAEQEGDWQRAYNETLQEALGPRELPTMTLEEAAALFPAGL